MGLGAETARAIASRGATVVLVARSAEKTGGPEGRNCRVHRQCKRVHVQVVDLADLELGRGLVPTNCSGPPFASIDVLINNAGIMACPLERTLQGFESQLGVNHMAHFVFTNGLLEALKAGDRRSHSGPNIRRRTRLRRSTWTI